MCHNCKYHKKGICTVSMSLTMLVETPRGPCEISSVGMDKVSGIRTPATTKKNSLEMLGLHSPPLLC